MKKNFWNVLLAPVDEGNKVPPPPGATPVPPPPAPAAPLVPKDEGEFDDLGYPIVKPETPPAAPVVPPPADPAAPVGKTATGYGDEPPVPPVVTPPVEPTKDEKISFGEGVEVDAKDISVEEQKKIAALATKHKLSKEIIQDYIDTRSAELKEEAAAHAKAVQDAEAAQQKLRSDWHSELKTDPTFGGEKYSHNVHRVEKMLNEYMPNVKKVLTERNGMLPPYFMRDLAAMADHLFGTDTLKTGEPAAPAQKPKDDALEFYTNP